MRRSCRPPSAISRNPRLLRRNHAPDTSRHSGAVTPCRVGTRRHPPVAPVARCRPNRARAPYGISPPLARVRPSVQWPDPGTAAGGRAGTVYRHGRVRRRRLARNPRRSRAPNALPASGRPAVLRAMPGRAAQATRGFPRRGESRVRTVHRRFPGRCLGIRARRKPNDTCR